MNKKQRAAVLERCLSDVGFRNTEELLGARYRVYWEDGEEGSERVVWFEARPVAVDFSEDGFALHFPAIQIYLDDPDISMVEDIALLYDLNRGWVMTGALDDGEEGEKRYGIDEEVEVEINP